jgi:hypothetical protein
MVSSKIAGNISSIADLDPVGAVAKPVDQVIAVGGEKLVDHELRRQQATRFERFERAGQPPRGMARAVKSDSSGPAAETVGQQNAMVRHLEGPSQSVTMAGNGRVLIAKERGAQRQTAARLPARSQNSASRFGKLSARRRFPTQPPCPSRVA